MIDKLMYQVSHTFIKQASSFKKIEENVFGKAVLVLYYDGSLYNVNEQFELEQVPSDAVIGTKAVDVIFILFEYEYNQSDIVTQIEKHIEPSDGINIVLSPISLLEGGMI